MIVNMQNNNPLLAGRYTWVSSDPEGMQHAIGLIMRQRMQSDLVIKGRKRLKILFEGGVFHKAFYESMDEISLGPMMEGHVSFYDIRKCMSKQVNYNQAQVERVSARNFKLLALICVILLLLSFFVLFFENVHAMMKVTRVTLL